MTQHMLSTTRLSQPAYTGIALLFILSAALQLQAISLTVPSEQIKTISQAMIKAKAGDTVWVEPGTYRENVFVSAGVVLCSRMLFKAIIDGGGRKKSVTLGANSAVIGFQIVNGDFGVYSTSTNNAVLKCRITRNRQSGVMCIGTLPRLEDNYIVYNEGSGIQGWDIRSTISAVSHNTIAYNSNNGIAIGGNSEVIIENNIIAFNLKVSIKADPTVRIVQRNNCFFGNTELVETLAESNISVDPLFINAQKLDFNLHADSQCRNNASDTQNIGSRLIY